MQSNLIHYDYTIALKQAKIEQLKSILLKENLTLHYNAQCMKNLQCSGARLQVSEEHSVQHKEASHSQDDENDYSFTSLFTLTSRSFPGREGQ